MSEVIGDAPGRVQLDYEIELYGGRRKVVPPLIVAVLADLHGASEHWASMPLADRKFREIDSDNFDDRIRGFQPSVAVGGADGAHFQMAFNSMEDFGPLGIARNHPIAGGLLERRTRLAELHASLQARPDLAGPLEAALRAAVFAADNSDVEAWLETHDEDEERRTALAHALADEMSSSLLSLEHGIVTALHDRVRSLDEALGLQVTLVLRDPSFRRLESAWRGVEHLVRNLGTSQMHRVRVFSVTRDELAEVEAGGLQTIRSEFEVEFSDMLGGQPYGLIVLDGEYSHRAADVALLRDLAKIGAYTYALVVAAAAPSLLDADAHAEIAPERGPRLERLPEYAEWRALRRGPESRHLAMVVPRVMSREPHRMAGLGSGEFRFFEAAQSLAEAPWMSGAFALAAGVLQVHDRDGWPAALQPQPDPVELPVLPVWTGVDAMGDLQVDAPLDARFDWEEASALARIGLTVLRCGRDGTSPALAGSAVVHQPLSSTETWPQDVAARLAVDQLARFLQRIVTDHPFPATHDQVVDSLRSQLLRLGARITEQPGAVQTEQDLLGIHGSFEVIDEGFITQLDGQIDQDTGAVLGPAVVELSVHLKHGFDETLPMFPLRLRISRR